jgi:hypothetical protein
VSEQSGSTVGSRGIPEARSVLTVRGGVAPLMGIMISKLLWGTIQDELPKDRASIGMVKDLFHTNRQRSKDRE